MATDVAVAPAVQRLLAELVESAKTSFQDDLQSIVLFGSGAEGRLRATSDLNLLIVLKRFDQARADQFREPLRMAHVAARASAMFVLESELAVAVEAFAVKFGDMARRRRVLFGDDPIASLAATPEAKKQRLRQVLMNLTLRLRQRYVMASLREEQLAVAIAETAGPLRAAAATLLEIEGRPVASVKEALQTVACSLGDGAWTETLAQMSEARESGRLPPGAAAPVAFRLMALVEALRLRVERLP